MVEASIADWLSAIAALVALLFSTIAIYQNNKQTKINNRQFLFKKRFELLKACHILTNSFSSYQLEIDKDDNYSKMLVINNLVRLTDNEIIEVKLNLLSEIGKENNEKQLEKCFRIPKELSEELSFVFENNKIGPLQIFLQNYSNFLISVSFYKKTALLGGIDVVKTDFNKLYESWDKVQEIAILTSLEKETKIFY
ncbi:hypothetical protein [Lactococcus lactis]|uniref:hypothetical protein n=1 Tax=Lactococcus lactis TaxID=1358 RepID=UPI0022E59F7A|nr:hypothetical protein [Lactococcus lactis]